MTDNDTPVFEREMTVRNGRLIHRTVSGSRNEDGSVTFEVEDEEVPDAAQSRQPPAPVQPVGVEQLSRQPLRVTHSVFEAAMGDPDNRWR